MDGLRSAVDNIVTFAVPLGFLAVAAMTNNSLSSQHVGTHGDNHERVAKFLFNSVFFPDSRTYIKHVFYPKTAYRPSFRFGDRVAVCVAAGEPEASLIPTVHVDVPPDLLQKALSIREKLGIRDQQAVTLSPGPDGSFIARPVTRQSIGKDLKGYAIILIFFLAVILLIFAGVGILIFIASLQGANVSVTFGNSASFPFFSSVD